MQEVMIFFALIFLSNQPTPKYIMKLVESRAECELIRSVVYESLTVDMSVTYAYVDCVTIPMTQIQHYNEDQV